MALALGIILLLLSFARIAGDLLLSPAGHVAVLESAIVEPIWQTRLGLNIAAFAAALIFLHLVFGSACWCLAVMSELAFGRTSRTNWLLVWYLTAAIWLFAANALFFPRSSLGEPYHALLASPAGRSSFYILSAALALLAAFAIAIAARRSGPARTALWVTTCACLILGAGAYLPPRIPAASSTPHVFILGIDSLRTDAVTAAGTPNVRAFLDGAVHMVDAITPLARTFPSWVSILTGRHPHTTGATINLLPRDRIDTGATLPHILRQHGFRTYYAIDETRFSNIDRTYGFDHTIAPRMGGSDFALSLAADTPLSNLIINTRLAARLFPHIHTNRAAVFTYDPDAFVARLDRELDLNGPTFLAAHFTLPHYPYTWATSSPETGNDALARGDYHEAIQRADEQLGDMLAMLEDRGALSNAIVVLVSDHGEALGQEDDLMPQAPVGNGATIDSQKWGHGSSVFSPSQYRVVLGLRAYGPAAKSLQLASVRDEPVSLLDLAPTIVELLDLPDSGRFDGVSLVPLLHGSDTADSFVDRIRHTETEYNPHGFTTGHMTASMLAQAARIYRLDPATDRVEVRPEMLDHIMANRQFAALVGNRALGAATPSGGSGEVFEFTSVPLVGNNVSDRDEAMLRHALQARFGILLD